MEIVFVTGMSGAGKSQAVDYLEDRGYFCMDNVPPYVLPDIVNSFVKSTGTEEFDIEKLAFVVDIRSQEFLDGFEDALAKIKSAKHGIMHVHRFPAALCCFLQAALPPAP